MKADYLGGLVPMLKLAPLSAVRYAFPKDEQGSQLFGTSASVRLYEGKFWDIWDLPDIMSFDESIDIIPDGYIYTAQVKSLPFWAEPTYKKAITEYSESFLCIAEFKNGTKRLLGDERHGCTLTINEEVSAGILTNGMSITIECQMRHECWYM